MTPLLTCSKAKKKPAPLPPNPFTGEVERPNGPHTNKEPMSGIEGDPDMEEVGIRSELRPYNFKLP